MRAIMVMFDSLNRHILPPYGGALVDAPNFVRLSRRSMTFTNSWVGSMPCMPARRDLHTGRYSFLHRSWGPLEPFDDSMPELLKDNGIHTHLATDHNHYWEDGGATYHTRYSTFEFIRGQEGDPWKGEVEKSSVPDLYADHPLLTFVQQDRINRSHIRSEEQFPQAKTFANGLEFMRTNADKQAWFLQIETFDPHEPFFAAQAYRDLYSHLEDSPTFDWPTYGRVKEPPEQVARCQSEYSALVSMCDAYLGKVLDVMDELEMWEDTMLIVSTDHGFLLGEHGWWGKCVQPFYNEVARTPLFVWDPRSGEQDLRSDGLVQMIDLAPTLLDFFSVEIPEDMKGIPLRQTMDAERCGRRAREAVLFGIHGGHVNCTDGRYVYMRAPAKPENQPLYNYTLMPMMMRRFFSMKQLRDIQLQTPFSFTKGMRVMKINASANSDFHSFGHLLFDLIEDPYQQFPIEDTSVEKHMTALMIRLMKQSDAPDDQFERLGL